MYLSTAFGIGGNGHKCASLSCDRIARFQIQFPSAHEAKHLCSACLAKIVETVFMMRETVRRLDSEE
jgi:hypothetical protein